MPYKSFPLGAFWTIFGEHFPTGVPQFLYPYQPANPLVESIFKALCFFIRKLKISSYIWATERMFEALSDRYVNFILLSIGVLVLVAVRVLVLELPKSNENL